MMDDLAGAHASGTFLKLRKFIFYFGRNQLYCISFCKQAFRGDIPGVFIFRADFRADVIHFIFILLLILTLGALPLDHGPTLSWTQGAKTGQ